MKTEIKIGRLNKKNLEATAKVYARVFADEPWNEVSRCNKCGEFGSTQPSQGKSCACGGAFDQEAYPVESTAKYIQKETSKPRAYAALLTLSEILGFGWGFKQSSEGFQEEKYRTAEMKAVLAGLLSQTDFYYVSEIGVVAQARGQKLGKFLTGKVIDAGRRKGFNEFILRTNENSAMRYIAEGLGMKAIVGLQSQVKDTENPERVIFRGER